MDGNGDSDMAEQMEKLKERTKAFAAQLKAEKAELEALAAQRLLDLDTLKAKTKEVLTHRRTLLHLTFTFI